MMSAVSPLFSVHKFGGSVLGDAAHCASVRDQIKAHAAGPCVIVVSALAGVTDRLAALAQAAAHTSTWHTDYEELIAGHRRIINDVTTNETARADALGSLAREAGVLDDLLRGIQALRAVSNDAQHAVMGYGEVFSAILMHALLNDGQTQVWHLLDAREVIVATPQHDFSRLDWDESTARFTAWRAQHAGTHYVATGYIARTPDGRPTTLGRNGSDYSAAVLAVLFSAQSLTLWKDVDGFMTANPKWVREAHPIAAMTYDEARELAHFGARILHPHTLIPAKKKKIPIYIRNGSRHDTLSDDLSTRIDSVGDPLRPIKGVTTLDDLTLLGIEGAGMMGVTGIAERFFGALRRANVSALMISQSISEQTINGVVRAADQDRAHASLEAEFAAERANGLIERVTVRPSITALSIVGDGLPETIGSAARLMTSLSRSRINIRAIAQADSERSISVAIDGSDSRRALRAVHAGCLLSANAVALGIIGVGTVGSALLAQIATTHERLIKEYRVDLRLRAVAASRTMVLADRAMNPVQAVSDVRASALATDLKAFAQHLRGAEFPDTMIVDLSGSDIVANHYPEWLASGIHVVTCSKHAGSGRADRYTQIMHTARNTGACFRYEATVGAGLPVIQTLRDLVDTGDSIDSVTGIFSGTLAFLFHGLAQGEKFSDLIRIARTRGYTEPDPRDDLSGLDVARKLVILTREAGRTLSLEDITIDNLVPPALRSCSVDDFMNRLGEMDAAIEPKRAQAAANGQVLRYTAQLGGQDNRPSVGLQAFAPHEPLALGNATDNIIQFKTARYNANPLVVQGPGAGADVTAMGVFSDMLRIVGINKGLVP